jgi:Family of unknown function (DUF6262)
MTKQDAHLGWVRNTSGIKLAADKKRQDAFERADKGIKQLIKDKRPINFESVAEVSNVTRAWLYKQPELRSRIESLREQQGTKQQLPPEQRASDKSKDAMIATLREQNKKLRAEILELKQQIEVAYGQILVAKDKM